jgi:hypothetical protein
MNSFPKKYSVKIGSFHTARNQEDDQLTASLQFLFITKKWDEPGKKWAW